MSKATQPTAAILVIGNEILSGRTRDINIQFLAKELGALGIRVVEARVIPDEEPVIISTVHALRAAVDYVFTTGGIGPTHDDITAKAMANAFDVTLLQDPRAEAMLRSHYKPGELTPARLKMAQIPAGAKLIENPVSRAPGFILDNVFVMAGVPAIVEAMFASLKSRLKGGPPSHSVTVTGTVMEGELGGPLAELAADCDDLDIGSYPYYRQGLYGVSVVVRGIDKAQVAATAEAVARLMSELGGAPEILDGTP